MAQDRDAGEDKVGSDVHLLLDQFGTVDFVRQGAWPATDCALVRPPSPRRINLPLRCIEQALDPWRLSFSLVLRQFPTVLPLHSIQQAVEVALGLVQSF
jgi:hypothetical protein